MAFINLSQLTKAVKGLVNKINSENYVISNKIGDLSDLDTTDKSNLVAAVNEAIDSSGVSDYTQLTNKPSINSTTLTGNKTAADLGLVSTTGDAYRALSIPMGQVDSTSTSTVMTAQIDGITELRDGICMWLRNTAAPSASGFTLNINGLGAKPCWSSTSGDRIANEFKYNYTFLMIYNSTRVTGGCWDVVYGYDTTYSPASLGFVYGACRTAAADVAKQVNVGTYDKSVGGIVVIEFYEDVPAGATLNIFASGVARGASPIYYRGAAITAGVIKAGDTVTMIYSTKYYIISIDRNEASVTMTDTEVDAAVDAAFVYTYTITNQSPTLVSVQSSASAGETVTVTNIYNGSIEIRIGTTSGGYDITYGHDFRAGTQANFTMPDTQVFISASIGGGSND